MSNLAIKHKCSQTLITIAAFLICAIAASFCHSKPPGHSASGKFTDAPMGAATARAMLERFGYGATLVDIERIATLTPREYIERGIQEGSVLPGSTQQRIDALQISAPAQQLWEEWGPGGNQIDMLAMDQRNAQLAFQKETQPLVREAIDLRLLKMANSDNQAHEILLSFWLNHFSIFVQKHFDRLVAKTYVDELENAMREDSFEALLRASFYSPAMQMYLDNAQSTAPDSEAALAAARKGKQVGINENLAREMLELHTLGVDANYTQKDVQELARIITGAGVWSPKMRERALERAGAIREGLFLFDPRRHDFSAKQLLGQTYPAGHGADEIDRALHQLATHPATARHLSRKLALRFVSDDPSPALIGKMSKAWIDSNGRISVVLMTMLDSSEFRESLAARAKFKEPVDYILSVARAACQQQPIDNGGVLTILARDGGQAPFLHSTPDGYPPREGDWLSPAAMAKRVRLAMGVAAQRIPLRDGPPIDSVKISLKGGGEPKLNLWGNATPCTVDGNQVEKVVGTLSETSLHALAGLQPVDRTASILASPEFMRR